jgi:hypothetical protein
VNVDLDPLYTAEQIEDYRGSKMGDLGEYEKAQAQGYDKDFDTFLKEVGRSRAMRISIGEKVKTREALNEVDALGVKGLNMAKNRVEKYKQSIEYKTAVASAEPEEQDAIARRMERIKLAEEYQSILFQVFGEENVVPSKKGGKPGWYVVKDDGTTIWKDAP